MEITKGTKVVIDLYITHHAFALTAIFLNNVHSIPNTQLQMMFIFWSIVVHHCKA